MEGACARAFFSTVVADERLDRSGSGTVIVVQHAAQALPALDLSRASEVAGLWTDESVLQSLMIALAVIMSNEVLNAFPQGLLAEEDHAIQTGILDAAHKSLRVGVRMCLQMRRMATLRTDLSG